VILEDIIIKILNFIAENKEKTIFDVRYSIEYKMRLRLELKLP